MRRQRWHAARVMILGAGVLLIAPAPPPAGTTDAKGPRHVGVRPIRIRRGAVEVFAAGRPVEAPAGGGRSMLEPRAMARGDFDGDGVQDLAVGYSSGEGGRLAILRGNPAWIAARTGRRALPSGRNETLEQIPFEAASALIDLPRAPDFLEVGDFDLDGDLDLLAAAIGDATLWLLPGDGRGEFQAPRSVDAPAGVFGMAARTTGLPGDLPDLAVVVRDAAGEGALLVATAGDWPGGDPLPIEIARGPLPIVFDESRSGRSQAIALGSGSRLDLIGESSPHDPRPLRGNESDRGALPRAGSVELPWEIGSMALGDFEGDGRLDLALLTREGEVRLGPMPGDGGEIAGMQGRSSPFRRLASASPGAGDLMTVRMSGGAADDLLVIDRAAGTLTLLVPSARGTAADRGPGANERGDRLEIDLPGRPIVVRAMRLNGDALDDLVVLTDHAAELAIILSAPVSTFTVTQVLDDGPGSLRQAILDANASAGQDLITFDLSGTPPHAIRPLSPLPAVSESLTIDGATQAGFIDVPVVALEGDLAGPGAAGLTLTAGPSVVRGLAINRFAGNALHVSGAGGHVIEGNHIGTDPGGTIAMPNAGDGILIEGSAGNTIGGTLPESRNLISGNGGAGIRLGGALSSGNLIQGNYIGTGAAGTEAIGNSGPGIAVEDAPANTLGGSSVARNLIVDNRSQGVLIVGGGAGGNSVQSNMIGGDPIIMVNLGNTMDGIRISASGTLVGGPTNTLRNTIAFNGASGVSILSGTGNRLQRNIIEANGALGIDLEEDGVTANDPDDLDSGANGLQNYPIITRAITDAISSQIEGTLQSSPGVAFTVEFFSSLACDPSGHGEGRQIISSRSVTTDGTGNAAFSYSFFFPLPANAFLTATATSPAGSTSEFSPCHRISDQTPVEVTGVQMGNASSIIWSPVDGADSYNVHRGLAHFAPNLLNSARESCLRLATTATGTGNVVTESPPVDSAYLYLVAGVNTFGEGFEGEGTDGPRSLDSFGPCPTCAHDKCGTGPALDASCEPCVGTICALQPSCCGAEWSPSCVDRIVPDCGNFVCESAAGSCPHTVCVTGGPLTPGCDAPPASPSCVDAICALDHACCGIIWDSLCVDEVETVCGKVCN